MTSPPLTPTQAPPPGPSLPPGPPESLQPAPPELHSPPPPGRKNTATLHLCAAAYLDRRFRDRVVDEIYSRPERAIAPNPGTDAVPILRHVLRARAFDIVQQALLAGLLALLVFAPVANKLSLVLVLLLWAFIGQVTLPLASRPTISTGRLSPSRWKRLSIGVAVGAGIVGGLVYLAPLHTERVFFDIVIGEYRWAGVDHFDAFTCIEIRYGDSFRDSFSECAGYSTQLGFAPGTAGAAIWALALGVLTAVFGVLQARSLVSIPAELEPLHPANRRVHVIAESQRAPVVTYNAAGLPFVGSGIPRETWQFAMALRPSESREEGSAAVSIDPVSLNGHVRDRLRRLGESSATTTRLPNLVLSDHLYVSDREVPKAVRYPYELAQSGYPFQTVEQVQCDPSMPVRHYLKCEATSWDGELVNSVFLHCALQGETLYVEFTGCVLPPTQERFKVFGYSAPSRKAMIARGLLRGVASMPVSLVRSPVDTLRNLYRAAIFAARKRGEPKWAGTDNGAVISIRELGSSAVEQNYFQGRDAVKYIKVLERQILDALTEYLRENNVDTSELEERVTAIVNNGVVNYGELNAGAVGKDASAKVGSIGGGSRGSVKGA